MKLARFRVSDAEDYGILREDSVVSLTRLSMLKRGDLPKSLDEFVGVKDKTEKAKTLIRSVTESDFKSASYATGAIVLLAPLVSPGKIICLGLNYYDHAEEQRVKVPSEPVIFMKPRTAIIGPSDDIVKPNFVKQLDYEAELAIVIGKKGKNIPVSEADDYVFGYTIMNDVSARDIQFGDRQWTRGKSFDTFAPLGPWIVTADELPDTSNLSICTWINDELRQSGSTRNMVFKVPQIIYHLSRVMTLEPGDVIATGTPSGVGFALKPQPKFLKPRDTVRIKIEGIGILENKVISPRATLT